MEQWMSRGHLCRECVKVVGVVDALLLAICVCEWVVRRFQVSRNHLYPLWKLWSKCRDFFFWLPGLGSLPWQLWLLVSWWAGSPSSDIIIRKQMRLVIAQEGKLVKLATELESSGTHTMNSSFQFLLSWSCIITVDPDYASVQVLLQRIAGRLRGKNSHGQTIDRKLVKPGAREFTWDLELYHEIYPVKAKELDR